MKKFLNLICLVAVTLTATLLFAACGGGSGSSVTGPNVTVPATGSDSTAPITTASVPAGTYTSAQSVTLTCADNSGGVGCDKTYYTTNGSTPTTAST